MSEPWVTTPAYAQRTSGVFPARTGAAAPADSVRWLSPATLIAAVATLGLLFQVGHFAEHAVQFGVWVLGDLSNICSRDTPWMSPWVHELVKDVALTLFPTADAARRVESVRM